MKNIELHYQKLANMYLGARVNTEHFSSSQIKISDGQARIELLADSDYHHALKGMHGSVYFKMLDDAAFFAVSSVVTDYFVLTTSFNLNIIRPFTTGKVYSIGKVRFKSRELFTAESTLYTEKGKELAFGTGNFAKSKVALTDVEGYG